jgi:transposase-like protein
MKIDFDKFKASQYCVNELCEYFSKSGLGNVCTLSSKNNQVYCNGCSNRWVITKYTFFYDLRSDKSLIMWALKDLSEGKGQRAIKRTTGVNLETQKRWLLRAADHVAQISIYLEHDMHLERVQI